VWAANLSFARLDEALHGCAFAFELPPDLIGPADLRIGKPDAFNLRQIDARAMHQHGQVAELLARFFHGTLHLRGVGDVASEPSTIAPRGANLRQGLGAIESVQDRDAQAFAGQPLANHRPDAAAAAGDDSALSLMTVCQSSLLRLRRDG
jgi:hypothetical protein